MTRRTRARVVVSVFLVMAGLVLGSLFLGMDLSGTRARASTVSAPNAPATPRLPANERERELEVVPLALPPDSVRGPDVVRSPTVLRGTVTTWHGARPDWSTRVEVHLPSDASYAVPLDEEGAWQVRIPGEGVCRISCDANGYQLEEQELALSPGATLSVRQVLRRTVPLRVRMGPELPRSEELPTWWGRVTLALAAPAAQPSVWQAFERLGRVADGHSWTYLETGFETPEGLPVELVVAYGEQELLRLPQAPLFSDEGALVQLDPSALAPVSVQLVWTPPPGLEPEAFRLHAYQGSLTFPAERDEQGTFWIDACPPGPVQGTMRIDGEWKFAGTGRIPASWRPGVPCPLQLESPPPARADTVAPDGGSRRRRFSRRSTVRRS